MFGTCIESLCRLACERGGETQAYSDECEEADDGDTLKGALSYNYEYSYVGTQEYLG